MNKRVRDERASEWLAIGALLDGRYRTEAEIARGGMGVVYRATHLRLGLPRAVKLITPEYAQDRDYREHFETEAAAAAQIEHAHVEGPGGRRLPSRLVHC